MISEREFLTIVKDLNSLLPGELLAKIVQRAHKTYRTDRLPSDRSEVEAMVAEGKLLITISGADHYSIEGVGMWSKDGAGSWLVVGVEEEDVLGTPFRSATFGILPTTDTAFSGLSHTGREGRQRFILTHWPEAQRLDSNARGPYLLAVSTSDDQDKTDYA
ncbi:hypothetical protein BH11PAT4_BH11PAT4_2730 [soil metagenome]